MVNTIELNLWIREFWWIYLVGTFISKAFDKWCVVGILNITFEIAEDFRFDSLDIIFASLRFAIFLESVCAAITLGWQDVWVVVRKCCLDIFSKDTKRIPIDYFVDTKEETRFVIFESKVFLEIYVKSQKKVRGEQKIFERDLSCDGTFKKLKF